MMAIKVKVRCAVGDQFTCQEAANLLGELSTRKGSGIPCYSLILLSDCCEGLIEGRADDRSSSTKIARIESVDDRRLLQHEVAKKILGCQIPADHQIKRDSESRCQASLCDEGHWGWCRSALLDGQQINHMRYPVGSSSLETSQILGIAGGVLLFHCMQAIKNCATQFWGAGMQTIG